MRTCELDGCTKPHHARGRCKTHYVRLRRELSGLAFQGNRHLYYGKTCEVAECKETAKSNNKCSYHYMKAWCAANPDKRRAADLRRKGKVRKDRVDWDKVNKLAAEVKVKLDTKRPYTPPAEPHINKDDFWLFVKQELKL